jgi:hypothetical protein
MSKETETKKGEGHQRLWGWFGLSYASFLTLPRVLMHEMPDDWQGKMADLLEEYDATFDTSSLPNTTVRAVREGKLVEMPEFFKKYRRPEYEEIAACKRKQ